MKSYMVRTHAALALAALLIACDKSAPVAGRAVTRDSAGITIVESFAPAWQHDDPWRIDTIPFLSLGVESGDTAQMFSRIKDAIRLRDGSILVVDEHAHQLRLFDADGHMVKVAGRHGIGPGEFHIPTDLFLCRDEIWLLDFPARVLVWSLNLEYIRTFNTGDLPMWPLMCIDGRILLKEDVRTQSSANTIYVASLELQLAPAASHANVDPVLRIPLYERISIAERHIEWNITHPFSRTTVLAPYGTEIAMTGFHGSEIRTVAPDGTLRRILRGPSEDLSISTAVVNRYRNADLQGNDARFRTLLASIGMPMPESRPAFTALMVDDDGNFWARKFVLPGEAASSWSVFAAGGEYLGDLVVPPDWQLFQIGSDYIMAGVRDRMDVEMIQLFRVHKRR